jgi:hypothetical protein
MNPLSVTAALHYLAIIPIIPHCRKELNRFNRIYFGTILLGTTFSIAWHASPNSGFLITSDYLFAALWFLLDFMWYKLLNQPIIFESNVLVFLLYIASGLSTNYRAVHSLWHVLSAAKCLYVSYVIYKFDIRKNKNLYNLP